MKDKPYPAGRAASLVAALICVESQGRVNAVTQNRVGLMQIDVEQNMTWITKHFPHINSVKTLMKARYNVIVGTFALSSARQGIRSEKGFSSNTSATRTKNGLRKFLT
jgi:hypothetical protein